MKTVKAYKLFKTLHNHPGEIFPLFIGKDKPTPLNKWVSAEILPTKGYALRPGWHVKREPFAPHLTKKNRIWAEVEIHNNIDWQGIADKQPTKDIRNRIPSNGFYTFKRPTSQGGEWLIAGEIKVNRLLFYTKIYPTILLPQ